MDITLLVFILVIALFFISVGYFNKSWIMAIVGGILVLMLGVIIITTGIDTIGGKSQNQVFNLTTSNDQIQGNLASTNQITFTNNKNIYTQGLSLIFILLGTILIYTTYRDTNGGG